MTNEEKHLLHYLTLFVGLVLFVILFIWFKYNFTAQLIVAASGSIYYVLWGIIHHAIENRLTRAVALEYILLGTFVFLLLFTALNI
jgi:hypothetical protein